MKKLITLALIIGATTLTQAQGNLVFNQVLNFNVGIGETVTVPDGKAWKLESGISQGSFAITSTNQEYGNNLDSSNSPTYPLQTWIKPLWLGQGTSLTLANASTDDNYLSILEFNVVAISSGSGGDSGGGVSADGFTASGIINLEFSGTNSSGNIGTKTVVGNITVPEGKIWKIISSSFVASSDSSTISIGVGFGGDVFVDDFIVTASKSVYLSAGTYEVAGKAAASGGGGEYILAKIGGLEYNAN